MTDIRIVNNQCVIRIVICVSIIAILMAFIYIWSYNPNSIIPHRELESAIREQIGKPTGEITPEDCRGVRELNLSDSSYNTNLEGLQYFVDLEQLRSTAGLISDLSALSELSQLREIDISSNRVKDLTPLSKLTNLEELVLQSNQVSDLNPLSSLTNLKHLVIGQNPVEDLHDGFIPLAKLEGLRIGAYADYEVVVGRDELVSPHAK